jgi:hypothetical protein
MIRPHPVHALEASLETARFKAVEELASKGGVPSADDVRHLAALQAALTAVREEIDDHGDKLCWSGKVVALD